MYYYFIIFVSMKNYISKFTRNGLSIFGWVSFVLLLALLQVSPTLWTSGIMWYGSWNEYSNPVTSFSGAVQVSTGSTKVTLTQPVLVSNNSISVVVPTGTEVSDSAGWAFDVNEVSTDFIYALPVTIPSNEQDVGKIKFWITGKKLNFSKPVRVQIPVSTTASSVRIKVKHAGIEWYQTYSLTDTIASNCFNGIATPSSNVASVVNGVATIYTCSASEFVAVTDKQTSSSSSSSGGGWGGWGVTLVRDNCPSWDFSPSYYDKTCGNIPTVLNDAKLSEVTKELSDMVISMKGTGSIANTTVNEQIRFKYIVESKVETAKYAWYDIKYISTYDLSKNTTKLSMAVVNNKTLTSVEKQRYVAIINEFLVARYNYELAQTKNQVLRNKYNKQTILLNNLVKKLGK